MDPPPQGGAEAAGQQPNAEPVDSTAVSKRPIGNRRFSPNLNNRMRPEESPVAGAAAANTKATGKDFRKFQRPRNPVKSEEDAGNSYGIMPHYVAAERVAKASPNSSAAHASGGAGEHSNLGGSGGGSGFKSSSGIGGSLGSAKAVKANKASRVSSSIASGLFSNVLNDTAPVTLPLCLEPPSVKIYSDPFCVPAPALPAAAAPSAVSSTFGPENKMFFIQLPRTFPALPSDVSASPSERPFYNNITQMSTTGSRFHVDPLPVTAAAASSAMSGDFKPILPIDARSSASGLLIPPAEESVVIKEEDDSSDDMSSAQKVSVPSDQAPAAGSSTYTAPTFDILDTREDHVSDKFMNSGQLGTMRFWKSGRVTMMVGGIEFNVSRGAESNFLQQVQRAAARAQAPLRTNHVQVVNISVPDKSMDVLGQVRLFVCLSIDIVRDARDLFSSTGASF